MFRPATKFAPRSSTEFQLAHESGYRSAELWLDADLIEGWESIVTLAGGFMMDFALHFPNRGKITDQQLRNTIDLYHALGCTALVIHQPMFDRYGKKLFGLDPDLRLGIENHDLESDADFEAWADDSRFLTLDVEHLWIYTVKDRSLKRMLKYMDWLLAEFSDKLVHVHLPGYLPGFKVHRPQYCSRKMVQKVFTMLADAGFEGMVVSETAKKFQNAEELKMDVLLHRLWRKRYDGLSQNIDALELQEIR